MSYLVDLTPLAERDYNTLHRKAEKYLKNGGSEDPLVLTFDAVEQALQTILVEEPERGLRLAGIVSYLYTFPAAHADILYRIRESRSRVTVISIDEQIPGLWKTIDDELEKGNMSYLMMILGIKPRLNQIELTDDVVM